MPLEVRDDRRAVTGEIFGMDAGVPCRRRQLVAGECEALARPLAQNQQAGIETYGDLVDAVCDLTKG